MGIPNFIKKLSPLDWEKTVFNIATPKISFTQPKKTVIYCILTCPQIFVKRFSIFFAIFLRFSINYFILSLSHCPQINSTEIRPPQPDQPPIQFSSLNHIYSTLLRNQCCFRQLFSFETSRSSAGIRGLGLCGKLKTGYNNIEGMIFIT
jgi:hypothetical protein